ncbi:MAG: amidohydrolase family protein [Firmicutes bacterium]|nr:amidohydrolase family protein [Bacillota bacterium]
MHTKLYDCHGHIALCGTEPETFFGDLAACGISYIRDGGDANGKSLEAKKYIAQHPELGVEYATPVFATHKKGRYGGIVGLPFEDFREFRELVAKAASLGADFIKIMYSGIITFKEYGELSCLPLSAEEIKELVNIAHGEGFAVMAHCNGRDAVLAAIEAGTDSIEHGAFMDDECIAALAESDSVWVPTMAAITAFCGRPGFSSDAADRTAEALKASVSKAYALGAKIAAGSDCGAFGVPAGPGSLAEYDLLRECGVPEESIAEASELIRVRFRRWL